MPRPENQSIPPMTVEPVSVNAGDLCSILLSDAPEFPPHKQRAEKSRQLCWACKGAAGTHQHLEAAAAA